VVCIGAPRRKIDKQSGHVRALCMFSVLEIRHRKTGFTDAVLGGNVHPLAGDTLKRNDEPVSDDTKVSTGAVDSLSEGLTLADDDGTEHGDGSFDESLESSRNMSEVTYEEHATGKHQETWPSAEMPCRDRQRQPSIDVTAEVHRSNVDRGVSNNHQHRPRIMSADVHSAVENKETSPSAEMRGRQKQAGVEMPAEEHRPSVDRDVEHDRQEHRPSSDDLYSLKHERGDLTSQRIDHAGGESADNCQGASLPEPATARSAMTFEHTSYKDDFTQLSDYQGTRSATELRLQLYCIFGIEAATFSELCCAVAYSTELFICHFSASTHPRQ